MLFIHIRVQGSAHTGWPQPPLSHFTTTQTVFTTTHTSKNIKILQQMYFYCILAKSLALGKPPCTQATLGRTLHTYMYTIHIIGSVGTVYTVRPHPYTLNVFTNFPCGKLVSEFSVKQKLLTIIQYLEIYCYCILQFDWSISGN